MPKRGRVSPGVHARLVALRRPTKFEESRLGKLIIDFLGIPVDLNQIEYAGRIMERIREECMRSTGEPLWYAWLGFGLRSRLFQKVREFCTIHLTSSLSMCFDVLEKHAKNELFVRCKVNEDSVVVKLVDWESDACDGELILPAHFGDDGISHRVRVVDGSVEQPLYYAADASPVEMGARDWETKQLSLREFLHLIMVWPRVRRQDSLYDAFFSAVEEHIHALDLDIQVLNGETRTTFKPEEMLLRLGWMQHCDKF
jgi:hypothetical protein